MYNFQLGNAPLTSFTDLFPFPWIWQNPDRIAERPALLHHPARPSCSPTSSATTSPVASLACAPRCPSSSPHPPSAAPPAPSSAWNRRIPSRTALIAIGASGPIAGFCVALPTTCYGLLHSTTAIVQTPPSIIRFEAPQLISLLHRLLSGSHPEMPAARPDGPASGPGRKLDRHPHHRAQPHPRRPARRRPHRLRPLAHARTRSPPSSPSPRCSIWERSSGSAGSPGPSS